MLLEIEKCFHRRSVFVFNFFFFGFNLFFAFPWELWVFLEGTSVMLVLFFLRAMKNIKGQYSHASPEV